MGSTAKRTSRNTSSAITRPWPRSPSSYLDFIDRFEADPVGALQSVCTPFTQPEDYSWTIYVKDKMIEGYGTPEQLAEYRRQEELRKTPESKARRWMGPQIFPFSHADYVDHAWAASRTAEELDTMEGNHVRAKKWLFYPAGVFFASPGPTNSYCNFYDNFFKNV